MAGAVDEKEVDAGTPAAEPDAPAKEAPAQQGGAIRSALAEARARLAEGKPLVPTDDEEEEGAAEEPTQDPEAGAEEGQGEEGSEESGAEKEEAVSGDEEKPEPEAEGVDDGEVVVFAIPPRNPNEPEIEIEVEPELQEHLARLKNGYMRGENARELVERAEREREEVRADRDEIALIDAELEQDPVGFVSSRVAPQYRKALLLELLADDELWKDEELQENLRTWEHDPDRRESFRTKQENERLKAADERRRKADEVKAARAGAAKTAALVRGFVQDEEDPGRREKFHRLAMNRLGELAFQTGRTEFSRKEVVSFLEKEGVLDGYGLDPRALRTAAPVQAGADASPPRQEGDRSTGRPKPAVRARRPTADEARETGKRLKEGSERRRAAASVAPTGAGTPAAGVELPKGQSVKERIEYVRRRGLAAVMGEA